MRVFVRNFGTMTMKKFGFVVTMVFLLGGTAVAQREVFAIGALDSLLLDGGKPVLVLLSTEGCKYCLMQKHQLAKNAGFSGEDRPFHYVEFEADRRDSVVFGQRTFRYKPTGTTSGIHELAVALNGSERVAFPTWVLLDAGHGVLFRHGGVLTPPEMKKLLEAIETMEN